MMVMPWFMCRFAAVGLPAGDSSQNGAFFPASYSIDLPDLACSYMVGSETESTSLFSLFWMCKSQFGWRGVGNSVAYWKQGCIHQLASLGFQTTALSKLCTYYCYISTLILSFGCFGGSMSLARATWDISRSYYK